MTSVCHSEHNANPRHKVSLHEVKLYWGDWISFPTDEGSQWTDLNF